MGPECPLCMWSVRGIPPHWGCEVDWRSVHLPAVQLLREPLPSSLSLPGRQPPLPGPFPAQTHLSWVLSGHSEQGAGPAVWTPASYPGPQAERSPWVISCLFCFSHHLLIASESGRGGEGAWFPHLFVHSAGTSVHQGHICSRPTKSSFGFSSCCPWMDWNSPRLFWYFLGNLASSRH